MCTAAALGCAAAAAALLAWAVVDYRRWVALGAGGLPHHPGGWLVMTALRVFERNPRQAAALRSVLGTPGDNAYLGQLVRRSGARPVVPAYPIPQRQLTDLPDASTRELLRGLFARRVAQDPGQLTWATSAFEKHNQAIALRWPACGCADARRWHGEVAHIHPSDGSMHMILSPSDAAQVVTSGWGELHSLSGRLGLLPASYTFVYAPRNAEDLQVVDRILNAAVAHMGGPAQHSRI